MRLRSAPRREIAGNPSVNTIADPRSFPDAAAASALPRRGIHSRSPGRASARRRVTWHALARSRSACPSAPARLKAATISRAWSRMRRRSTSRGRCGAISMPSQPAPTIRRRASRPASSPIPHRDRRRQRGRRAPTRSCPARCATRSIVTDILREHDALAATGPSRSPIRWCRPMRIDVARLPELLAWQRSAEGDRERGAARGLRSLPPAPIPVTAGTGERAPAPPRGTALARPAPTSSATRASAPGECRSRASSGARWASGGVVGARAAPRAATTAAAVAARPCGAARGVGADLCEQCAPATSAARSASRSP